jgi:hypothetical protein
MKNMRYRFAPKAMMGISRKDAKDAKFSFFFFSLLPGGFA